jgi:hypothetical protein
MLYRFLIPVAQKAVRKPKRPDGKEPGAEEAWQMMIDHLVRYLGRAGAAV